LATAKVILVQQPDHAEPLRAIEQAQALAPSDVPRHEAVAQLGQGWVAEEALAIAIYCGLVARDFQDGVILAVNHDGDSDSTGAITGNLLGTMLGVRAIPWDWLEPLELRAVIEELAEDLFACHDWHIGEYIDDPETRERIWRKYPGF
jgi:ADP-ribosylglycohydrolase